MTTSMIGYFAVLVFGLMIIGIILTGIEYRRLNRKDDAKAAEQKRNK
ncbi:MAG TPA: hypothetical protein PKC03_03505 [Dokdonella sp.]|jgi:uncharacterized membrane protein (DUF485 family)|nr:hypothetical protein [Dokdonella sp.]